MPHARIRRAAPSRTPVPRAPAALAAPPPSALRQAAAVDHQGTVIALARGDQGTDLYYNVLDLKVSTAVDDQEWTGYVKLDPPGQVRPLGLDLVTVGDPHGTVLPVAGLPLKVVSDEKYVHVFQQSARDTLLLNRYMLKRVAPPGGGPAAPALEPVWEVRYQRSGKQDVPDGDRDSQGYSAPGGDPFIEPTLELPVRDLADGRFEALILPNQTGTANRWQFFAANARTGTLDLYSFPMDEDGLPDLTGAQLDAAGNVVPDVSAALEFEPSPAADAAVALAPAGVPSAAFYTLHERVRATAGDDLLLKRSARVMLALPVTRPGGPLEYATLDFAVGKDGRLAQLPARTVVTPVSPANYALHFSDSAYLSLPDHASLKPAGPFKTEFWFYPDGDVTADQFVFRGDPAVPAKDAAPYVRIGRDLRITLGFGTGTAEVSAHTADPVVTPGQWVHVTAAYDDGPAAGNFTVLINGNAVPVTGADVRARPFGSRIAGISGPYDGIVGIVDGLKLWNGAELAADWEFDSIDYAADPPTTPDSTPNRNAAAVHGATLVPSSAPTGTQSQGSLVIDPAGLSLYCGLLDFAVPGGPATLTAGAGGLLHLYFAGRPEDGRDGLFCVAQYDAEVARAVYESGWTAATDDSNQTGTVQFTAARSGSFMNQAAIAVRPDELPGLCTVEIDDRLGRTERWRGVPRAVDDLVAVLNGASTHDLADPAFRAGARVFYDNTGTYAMSRLAVRSHGSAAGMTLLSRRPAALQLGSAAVADTGGGTCSLTLAFDVDQWTDAGPVTQSWIGLPVHVGPLLTVLSGTAASYDYTPTDSADSAVYGLLAFDAAQSAHDVLVLARPDVRDLIIGVHAGAVPELCSVDVGFVADGAEHRFELLDVPRGQAGFAAALNAHPVVGQRLLLVTDGLGASLPDRPPTDLPLRDLRAWSTLTVAFPEETLATDATVPAQGPVPAKKRQRSTLTVDGRETPLDGPSTLFRALAATEPTNGGVALADDTAAYTGGTANLVTAAVDGGWTRVSPHKALSFTGANAVLWDQAAPAADVLAVAGDLTVETWCRPGPITAETARPRLVGYARTGSPDYPDEQIRWALGLAPAPSLYFTASTAISGSYDLKGADCTLQMTVRPQGPNGSGQVMQLVTTGVSKAYLTLSVGTDQKPVAQYADGDVRAIGRTALRSGAWTQLTATVEALDAANVRVRIYLDGVLAGEATGAKAAFTNPPSALTAGKTGGAFPMQANGAFMWARALTPDEVARTAGFAPHPDDPGLVIAWYLAAGQGATVTNAAVEGYPFVSPIRNPATTPWAKTGVYGLPWAVNRGYGLLAANSPLLGGWHHLALAYQTAYCVRLGGADYADCGADASLDFGNSFSLEACFTPDRTGAVQTLVSKPGNYELSANYDNTLILTVPTDSAAVGTLRVASTAKIAQGVPCYVAATVSSGAYKVPPPDSGPATQTYYVTILLYVNGVLSGSYTNNTYTEPVNIATSTQRLNLGRSSAGAAYFAGRLSDVRLWNAVLTAGAIEAVQRTRRIASTDGLVSWWRWSEGHGKAGYDQNGVNTAVLTANGLWDLYSANAALDLYVDGARVQDAHVIDPASVGGYGAEQFTLAARRTDSATLADPFTGQLSEVRIWNRARTDEQIREEMHRELTGAETGLAGYWTLDTGSGAVAPDATGHGNDGALFPAAKPPAWVTASAPISNETKEVYNVLGGLLTEYVERVSGIPSAVEYPDTRRDAYGALYSVMKRCYTAEIRNAATLITGFTVGDLDTVYAGQTQTAPSLVGFIEGAPPIPSENQTNPYWNDVNGLNSYAENTAVSLTQADSSTRVFSGSENTGDDTSVDSNVGLYISTSASTSVGIGVEADWSVFTGEMHLGYAGSFSTASAAEQDLSFGYGKDTTTIDTLSAAGRWEPAERLVNPEVGRRYVPDNIGYALVKSLTADLYLVKLQGSNTVVKLTLVPDPDIPEDVNIIPFPIDPGYVKNGTLDGMVGFVPDPSFPYADLQRSSYFRPLEAYSLKRRMERQDQQLEAYYRQFDTANLGRAPLHDPNAGSPADPSAQDSGFTALRDRILPADPSYDWQKGLAKRGVVNTYVWTSAGGVHTEESQLTDTYAESYTGSSSWDSSDGLAFDLSAAPVVGFYSELDVLGGGSVEVVSIREKDSESGFGLSAAFTPDRYLKRPVLDENGQPVGYTDDDAPGKVTGYRFMSFFLPPSEQNFADFNALVVDRNWLNNSADPNAAALRAATVQANGSWRVLHRTTYVSRVPPTLQPATADTAAPPVVPPAGPAGNTVLTRLIERQIAAPAPSPAQIGAAVTAVLGTSAADPGLLAAVLPWWTAFLAAAADPRSDARGELSALRVDLLDYMIRKYAAQAAEAGGAAIAQLLGRAAD
jgi:hypothetical protein